MLYRIHDAAAQLAFDDLRRHFFRIFEDGDGPRPPSAECVPLSVFDSGEQLVFAADVPGMSDKEIKLTLEQNVLTLQGERRVTTPEGYTPHRQERSGVRFSRSFALPFRVDAERSSAAVKDGVLTVTLQKIAEARPRTIAVRAS
jgi:HSP20 family protein